jgi:hypothetical protein
LVGGAFVGGADAATGVAFAGTVVGSAGVGSAGVGSAGMGASAGLPGSAGAADVAESEAPGGPEESASDFSGGMADALGRWAGGVDDVEEAALAGRDSGGGSGVFAVMVPPGSAGEIKLADWRSTVTQRVKDATA